MGTKIKTFDIALFLIPIIFVIISIAVIYSLLFGTVNSPLTIRQGIAAVIGLIAMVSAGFIDYRIFKGINWVLYLVAIALLVFVIIFGKTVNGAMNWINLGAFQLQPSEVAKAFVVISLASFFSSRIGKMRWVDVFVSGLIVALPLGLIMMEPDLGTGLVVVFLYFVMLFVARPTKLQSAFIMGTIGVMLIVFALAVAQIKPFGSLLHDYQRSRITTFLVPGNDSETRYGKGYNVRQAQISVGSGGLFGKGLGRGSQSQLQFLPEPHTDFIFAGAAESFGFLGSLVLILLYFYLITKILNVGRVAQDNFGLLISYGVASILFFQVVINIGMNVGLAPVTGIPLPFLSYGGSSLIMTLFLIGIIQSIFIRHKKISF